MPAPDPREVLRKHGLWAKKSWGQNFLVDRRALDEIARAAGAGSDDWVVEIGAGLGTLTARLAEGCAHVVAIERDRDMVQVLRDELGGDPRVEIAEANALTFDYAAVAARAGKKPIVVGNLPYQIASQLLFRIFDARASLARVVVMLQKEMADRIVAPPGEKSYGALSVMVRMAGEPRIVWRLSPGAFHPAPKVASAVLKIELFPTTRVPVADEAWFSKVVHAGFGMRRKTLRNALRAVAAPEAIERAFAALALDGDRRGETLSVEEFAHLSDALAPA
jgi:16S rRNA (adenine1518-N6/adenine1519-N6)-dimethyltransferase